MNEWMNELIEFVLCALIQGIYMHIMFHLQYTMSQRTM